MELLKNLEGMSADEQMSAVVELQKAAMKHLEEQKQASIGKSAEMVILGLKKIKSDFEAKFDSLNYDIQTKVANLKDGQQGLQGPKGEQGDRGLDGYQGKDGRDGKDGKDGIDGVNGVGVTDAKIDFDGSLVITLSDGREINVGEVVPVDVAEKIRTVHNIQSGSGGDSQTVLDAIAALQATIATYGTMATQNANNVAITGGTINNTTIGATTPSTGVFTTLTAQTEVLKGTGQNLIFQSQTYTHSSWFQSTVTRLDNQTTAPDGSSTAGTITSTNTVYGGLLRQTPVLTATTYTISAYVKKNNWSYVGLRIGSLSGAADRYAYFNFDTLATSTNGISGATFTATSVGSGWYRIALSGLVTASAGGAADVAVVASDGSSATNNGAGQIVYVWGVQLELGSVANTYIPTTTSQIYGTPTLSFSGVASIGLQSDGSLYETSAGTGNVRFYTNNIGQEQARVSHTASAVNYHQLTGSATGSGPIHSVAGSDTNIDLNLNSKGTGAVRFNTGSGEQVRIVNSTTSDYWVMQGSPTILYPDGTSANRNAALSSKGTSAVQLYTNGGNQLQLNVAHTASAVNYLQVQGNATGGAPTISAQGSDANAYLDLKSKGNLQISLYTGGGIQFAALHTASAVNYATAKGSATGFGVVFGATGSDTNIPLVLQPKGTGALQAQQTDSTATGGNARGSYATDLQRSRTAAFQVASGGNSFIGSGNENVVTSSLSACVAGNANAVTGYSSFVGAGNSNTASNVYSSITTGVSNVASGFWTTVINGSANTAAGYYNFIGNGQSNSGTSGSAVTTQSATMNGTTAVTLSGSNASIKVGQYITGTSIAGDTYVAAISGTSLTLSKVASGSSTSTLSFYTPHGVVVGGGNNQATGAYSAILGGGDAGTAANRNVASGDWSAVVGGRNNTASGNGSFIGGGGVFSGVAFANTSSGAASVIVGGISNTSSGQASSIVGGYANNCSGTYSFIGGGGSNISNATVSANMGGSFGTTRSIVGNHVFSACDAPIASASGVSQTALLVLGNETLNASPVVLRSNTAAASTTNQVILPNNSAYYFKGSVIANVTGGGNTKAWAIEGAIKRGANAASTALVGTPTVTSGYADAGASTWAITATADTTNGGLAITFTGQASTTIRCVAKLETTEVTF